MGITFNGGISLSGGDIKYETNNKPVWVTVAGNLGTLTSGSTLTSIGITLSATDSDNGPEVIEYTIVRGSLPTGGTLDSTTGVITGPVVLDGANNAVSFTVRASDGRDFTDREFNIIVNEFTGTLTWTDAIQQQRVVSNDIGSSDYFGDSVSLSADGNTMLVGSGYNANNLGNNAVYAFTRTGTTWTQQAKIQPADHVDDDRFGNHVSLSADGNTAIIASLFSDEGATNSGAAYIYTRSGSTWTERQKLTPSNPLNEGRYGANIDMSYDGNTCVIGSHFAESAYVYTRSGETWTLQDILTANDSQTNDRHGIDVSLNQDGNICVVGAYLVDADSNPINDEGAFYVYTRTGTTWTQQQKVTATFPAQPNRPLFGFRVDISSDGSTIVAGAYWETSKSGTAYVFTKPTSTWVQQQRLIGSDVVAGDYFSHSINISDDGSVILITSEPYGGDGLGKGYIFEKDGATWTNTRMLIPDTDRINGDKFGHRSSISSDGETIAITSREEDANGADAGGVYVFVKGSM